jgi:hypothetical protein
LPECSNGRDDDGDSFVDQNDPECRGPNGEYTPNRDTEAPYEPIIPTGSCVLDVGNGQLLGVFGYSNMNDERITIPAGTSNDRYKNVFDGRGTVPGQVVDFDAEFADDQVFAVQFATGETLTWRLQVDGGVERASSVSASSTKCKPIVPKASCIDLSGPVPLAVFGFTNPNSVRLSIPVGPANFFSPEPKGRGQLELFFEGTVVTAVKVPLDPNGTTWTVTGSSATASSSTPLCSGGCVSTSVKDLKDTFAATQEVPVATNIINLYAKYQQAIKKALSRGGPAARSTARGRERLAKRAALLRGVLDLPDTILSCPAGVCSLTSNEDLINRAKRAARGIRNQCGTRTRDIFNPLVKAKSADKRRARALRSQCEREYRASIEVLNKLPLFGSQCSAAQQQARVKRDKAVQAQLAKVKKKK